MSTGITYEDGDIKISVDCLLNTMNADDYKAFIKFVALDSFIIDKVVDYICDEDEEGFWTSRSHELREDILKRVEGKQIGEGLQYKWSFLKEIEEKLKLLAANRSMYSRIYHADYLTRDQKNALLDGFDSEYQTKLADAQVAEIYKIVKDGIEKLTKGET